MLIEKNISERIIALRFPLIIGIVFIHAYAPSVLLSDGSIGIHETGYYSTLTRELLSRVLARISVPMFYLISGYLYFFNFQGGKAEIINKLRARFYTLLIPYLFWNLAVFLLYAVGQSIPETSIYFSQSINYIHDYDAFDYVDAIIGITRMPIAYQFWFIRDLMVVVLLAPVIYYLLGRAPIITLLVMFYGWLFGLSYIYIASSESILFFYIGALLANKKVNINVVDNYAMPLVGAYSGLSILDLATKGLWWNYFPNKLGIIFGVMLAYYLAGALIAKDNSMKNALFYLSPLSFFVFAVHEPLLIIIKKQYIK